MARSQGAVAQPLDEDAREVIQYLLSHKATLSSPHFWTSVLTSVSLVVAFFLHSQIDLSSSAAAVAAVAGALLTALTAFAHAWKVVSAHRILVTHVATRNAHGHEVTAG